MDRVSSASQSDSPARTGPIEFVRGAHRWIFSCAPGEEQSLQALLADLVADPNIPFDLVDAALVGHQLSNRLPAAISRQRSDSPARRTASPLKVVKAPEAGGTTAQPERSRAAITTPCATLADPKQRRAK